MFHLKYCLELNRRQRCDFCSSVFITLHSVVDKVLQYNFVSEYPDKAKRFYLIKRHLVLTCFHPLVCVQYEMSFTVNLHFDVFTSDGIEFSLLCNNEEHINFWSVTLV